MGVAAHLIVVDLSREFDLGRRLIFVRLNSALLRGQLQFLADCWVFGLAFAWFWAPMGCGDFFDLLRGYAAYDQQCGCGEFCFAGQAGYVGPADLLLGVRGVGDDDAG